MSRMHHKAKMLSIQTIFFHNKCIMHYRNFLKSYPDTMNILTCAQDFLPNRIHEENVQYEVFWVNCEEERAPLIDKIKVSNSVNKTQNRKNIR